MSVATICTDLTVRRVLAYTGIDAAAVAAAERLTVSMVQSVRVAQHRSARDGRPAARPHLELPPAAVLETRAEIDRLMRNNQSVCG